MESKKINQLATELTPVLSDLTIIGDPSTGISKKITLSQMASLFTGTVEEYPNLASFPLVGTADTIYIALDTNVLYRWDTGLTSYVELSPNIINSLVFNDANGFDGTISLVGSVATLTITTALTTGSVGFIGASGALLQDNANFFWDDSNNRLGIGTNAPTTAIDVFGSGIIGRLNGTSTNNAFLGFASAGSNKWSIGNVQSDQRFRIFSETNTSELFTILQTGEIGIGINNPTTKLHIDTGSSALIANLDANVSIAKSISFRSDNSNRFNIEVSGTESGSNAGANFFIRRYSDAGSLIDTPLTIARSTGAISLAGTLNGTIANFNGAISSDQTDGGIFYTKTAGALVGLLTNTFQITGSGTKSDLNAYVYGGESFGVWTNAIKRLTIDGSGATSFSGSGTFASNLQTNATLTVGNQFSAGNYCLQIYPQTSNSVQIQGILSGTGAANISLQPSGGNVAIGTNNPLQLLYLQGSPIANNVFSGIGIGDANSERIRIGYNTLGITTGLVPPQIIAGVSNLFLATRDIGGADMIFQTGAGVTEKMRIKDNGNVAIGTSSPLQSAANRTVLTVNGVAGGSAIINIGTGDTLRTYLYADSGGSTFETVGTNTISASGANILQFNTNGSERMRIASGGNVLIGTGTDAGTGKLQVNGRAIAQSYNTAKGNTGTILNATWTDMFTVSNIGMYLVNARLNAGAGDATNYTAFANVLFDGAASRIVSNNGGILQTRLNGNTVQVLQNSGGAQGTGVTWAYTLVGAND
jgi:hypothetical protein